MAYLGGGAFSQDTAANTVSVAFSPANTTGSLLVAVVAWSSNATLAGLTDTAGNTWTLIGSPVWDSNDQSLQMAYALNAIGGANTVTAILAENVDRQYRRIVVAEYSGVLTTGAFDVTAGQSQANTTASNNVTSGNTATLAQASELVVSGTMDVNNATNTITAGTGYTKRSEAGLCTIEDKTVSATTAVAGTWTYATSGRAITHVATFKLASPGSATVTAVPATATASAPAPVVSNGAIVASVTAVVAVATALAVPSVVFGENVVTGGGPVTATAQANIPVISAETVISGAGPMTATATALPPVVTGLNGSGGTVVSVAATAAASAPAPVVVGARNGTVTGVAAAATATARVPVVVAYVGVTAVAPTAAATAIPPSLAAQRSPVTVAVAAAAGAAARVPGVNLIGGSQQPPAASATARVLAPDVEAFVPPFDYRSLNEDRAGSVLEINETKSELILGM